MTNMNIADKDTVDLIVVLERMDDMYFGSNVDGVDGLDQVLDLNLVTTSSKVYFNPNFKYRVIGKGVQDRCFDCIRDNISAT